MHTDYQISELDAYELLSKVARIHLVEMVDRTTCHGPNPQEIPAATQEVAAWRDETERGPLR